MAVAAAAAVMQSCIVHRAMDQLTLPPAGRHHATGWTEDADRHAGALTGQR